MGIVMPTARFVAANSMLAVAALLLPRVGWRRPTLAIFFHILPSILQSRVAPGTHTASLLYLPFSSWALVGATRDGVSRKGIAAGAAAGAGMMAAVVLGARALSQ